MTAEAVAIALGGRRAGANWMARCPAHDDLEPSLSIRDGGDGRVLVHCHAGCSQDQVIAAVRSRGLWGTCGRRDPMLRPVPRTAANRQPDRDDTKHSDAAIAIWRSSMPATGTFVEMYLRLRGILLPVPATLRFRPGLKHPGGGVWPAMVSLVTLGDDNNPLGIHRTFLSLDGAGKAPVDPPKMMLGPCRGGAVRLAASGDVLMVGEGIETALSVQYATGFPTWAALSAGGIASLILPSLPAAAEVVICTDNDANGSGQIAAEKAAARWTTEGRTVRIAAPPRSGMDFNDLLIDQGILEDLR